MWRRITSGAYIIALLTSTVSPGVAAQSSTTPVHSQPIRFWGDLGYEFRTQVIQDSGNLTQHLTTTNLNAAAYLWKPWFATLKGRLGLAQSAISRGDESGRRNIINGNSRFTLLPASRFPFEARYDRIDSQVSGELIGSPYVNTLWGVTQKYRTPGGNTSLLAGYDRNLQEREGEPNYSNDLYRLGLTQRFGKQFLEVNGSRQLTERQAGGVNNITSLDRTEDNLYARHSFRPSPSFTLETIANTIDTEIRGPNDFNDRRYLQLVSYAYWRPQNRPVTMTGSVRYFNTLTETADKSSEIETVYGQGGINYDITRYFRLTGNATVTKNLATGTNGVGAGSGSAVSAQSAGFLYHPAYIKFGRYSYNWTISETLRNRTGAEDEGQQLSGTLGHTLQHNTSLASGATLAISGSQSINTEFDTAVDTPHRLVHSASITWRQKAMARLRVSDSRTIGSGLQQVYQLISFRLAGNGSFSRYSSWTGNLSLQSVRQVTVDGKDTGFDPYATGSVVYTHRRAFDVPRLRFTSDLQLNARSLIPLPLDNTDYSRTRWENRFDYLIGRLEIRASLRLTAAQGQVRELLLLRAKRRFGN